MIAFLRMLIPLLIVLGVIYAIASLRARARAKDRLEDDWQSSGGIGDQDDFVDQGLDAYENSFRRKILLAIFVVPLLLIALMVYLTNYS